MSEDFIKLVDVDININGGLHRRFSNDDVGDDDNHRNSEETTKQQNSSTESPSLSSAWSLSSSFSVSSDKPKNTNYTGPYPIKCLDRAHQNLVDYFILNKNQFLSNQTDRMFEILKLKLELKSKFDNDKRLLRRIRRDTELFHQTIQDRIDYLDKKLRLTPITKNSIRSSSDKQQSSQTTSSNSSSTSSASSNESDLETSSSKVKVLPYFINKCQLKLDKSTHHQKANKSKKNSQKAKSNYNYSDQDNEDDDDDDEEDDDEMNDDDELFLGQIGSYFKETDAKKNHDINSSDSVITLSSDDENDADSKCVQLRKYSDKKMSPSNANETKRRNPKRKRANNNNDDDDYNPMPTKNKNSKKKQNKQQKKQKAKRPSTTNRIRLSNENGMKNSHESDAMLDQLTDQYRSLRNKRNKELRKKKGVEIDMQRRLLSNELKKIRQEMKKLRRKRNSDLIKEHHRKRAATAAKTKTNRVATGRYFQLSSSSS